MAKTFCYNKAPLLIGVIKDSNPAEAMANMRNAQVHGATGFDLHVSCLDPEYKNVETISRIINSTPLPVMALNYNITASGQYVPDTEENKVALLMKALEAGASCIDMHGYTFDLPSKDAFDERFADAPYSFVKSKPREVVVNPEVIEKQMDVIERAHAMGREVLISTHVGKMMPSEEIVDLALFLEKRHPDAIKIVSIPEKPEDLYEVVRTMCDLKQNVKTPVQYHGGGPFGRESRIINAMLGSYLLFCNDGYKVGSDPNQPDLQIARTIMDKFEFTK